MTLRASLAAGLALVVLTGCEAEPTTISGTVTIDGSPADNVEVRIFDERNLNAVIYTSTSGPDGRYEVVIREDDYLPKGICKVSVFRPAPVKRREVPPPTGSGDVESAEPDQSAELERLNQANVFPPRFGDPQFTSFELTVTPGMPTTLDLPVSKK